MNNAAIVERLRVVIEAHASQFLNMIKESEKAVDKFAKKAKDVGSKVTKYVSAGVTAVGGASLYAFSQFDKKMTESTSIIVGMTDEMRGRMEAMAKEIAGRTSTSAATLAESYYFLAAAGLSAEQSIAALDTVNRFSIAGAFDMALATDLLTDAQTALGLSSVNATENMTQMNRVADVLVRASTMANASTKQLSESLTNDAATAGREASQELEGLVAMLSAYAAKGKKGDEAGSLIGRALRLVKGEAVENAEAFAKYGIEVFDAQGNMRNFIDVIADMERAFKGMSDEQKTLTMTELGFETLAQKSVTPLLGMSQQMKIWEAELKKAGGTAQNVADYQMKSFSNQIKITKNQVELLAIEIGELLAPSVLQLNEALRNVIIYVRGLSDETKMVAVNVAKVLAVMGPLITFVGVATPVLRSLTESFAHVASMVWRIMKVMRIFGALAVVLNPWTIGIAAVAAAIGGITYLIVGPEGISAAWDTATSYATTFFNKVVVFMQNLHANLGIIWDWFSNNWKLLLLDALDAYITYVKNMTYNMFIAVKTLIRLWVAFTGWLTTAIPAVFDFIFSVEVMQIIIKAGNAIMQGLSYLAEGMVKIFKAMATGIYTAIVEGVKATYEIIVTFAKQVGKVIAMILRGEIPNPIELMKELAIKTAEVARDVAIKAGKAALDAAEFTREQMEKVGQQVAADFNKGASDLNFLNTAKDIIGEGIDEMVHPLEGFESRVKGLPDLITENAIDTAQAVADQAEAATEGANQAAEAAAETTEDATNRAIDNVESVEQAVSRAVESIEGKLAGSMGAQLAIDKYFGAAIGALNSAKGEQKEGQVVAKTPVQEKEEERTYRTSVVTLLTALENNTRPLRNLQAAGF